MRASESNNCVVDKKEQFNRDPIESYVKGCTSLQAMQARQQQAAPHSLGIVLHQTPHKTQITSPSYACCDSDDV
jgi:hypothetical protein